jgi:hypothetical protein
MSSFVKLVALFSCGLLATAAAAEKPAGDKSKKSSAKETAGKKDRKDKKPGKTDADPNAPKPIEVPMPNGRDAKGLKIPYRDEDGKLKMRFDIGVAKKIDDNTVEMSDLQIQTFDDEGEHEMTIDLPTSTLDLTTSVLTTYQAVSIKRDDFELHGNTMIFNTRTKQGGLGGKVRMLIYDIDNQTSATPTAAAPAPVAGAPATPEPNAK